MPLGRYVRELVEFITTKRDEHLTQSYEPALEQNPPIGAVTLK